MQILRTVSLGLNLYFFLYCNNRVTKGTYQIKYRNYELSKMKRTFYYTLLFIAGIGIGKTIAQDKQQSLLWKVSGNGLKEPSYLFGTYHLLNEGFLDEKPEVRKIFGKSKGVAVEMVIDSSKLMQVAAMSIMPGKKISDMISEEDFALVSAELEKTMGFKLQMLNQFKPMAIMVMLVGAYAQSESGHILEKYEGLPLDLHFAQSAKQQQKKLTAFETMEEQIKLLYDYTPFEEQAKELVKFVKEKENMLKAQNELLAAYMAEDFKAMVSLYDKYGEIGGMGSHILDDRNIRWMEKLPGLMASGSQFVAVGALHLPGEKGLITLLRERGYKVEPIATRP